MNILFTAAAPEELQSARNAYEHLKSDNQRINVSFAVTGMGTTSLCYKLTKILNSNGIEGCYDMIVNVGVAGSYTSRFPVGTVVNISTEQFGDSDAASRSGFQTIFDYSTLDANAVPFINGVLKNTSVVDRFSYAIQDIPSAVGITFQTKQSSGLHGGRIERQFTPEIDTMEGAAFFYVCMMEDISFIELRAVSYMVGEEDRTKWNVPLALNRLYEVCIDFLGRL
ncbi:MAG: hypothetical protein PHD11_05660 [Bacteroidales bacterium]|nr:hypothetical protein [Bacteroidales bacterium]MDD4670541.1 hypothetical protein [Bacteroidales bacterium]